MIGRYRHVVSGYLIPLFAVGLALLVRWPLYPLLQDRRPYLTLFAAVAFAVWFARWRPATLAAILGFLAVHFFLIEQGFTIDLLSVTEFLGYALSMGFLIFFGEAMHRARERAEAEAKDKGRAQESEQREKEWLRVALASVGDAVLLTDAHGVVTYLNAEAEQLTGWTNSEAAGKPIREIFPIVNEETGRAVDNPIEKALRLGTVVGLANHTVLLSKDGRRIPIDDSAAPIRDPGGPLLGVVLVFRNVSEQRSAHHAKARLAAIVESSGDAILTKDLDGVVQTWNASAQALFGYAPDEIIGKPITLLVPADRLHEETEILARLRNGIPSERIETVRQTKDGRRIPVELSVSPVRDSEGKVVGASTIVHNITDVVAAREALAQEKERLATTLASIGDGVITTDAEARVTYLNRVAETVTGWNQLQAVGQPLQAVFRIVNEHTRRDVENPALLALRDGVVVGLANHTVLIRRDGTEVPIDDSAAPIRDKQGRIVGCVLIFRDITARRRADVKLRESEERFRRLVEGIVDGILTIDEHGIVQSLNPAAEALFGYRSEEVIGRNVKMLMPEPYSIEHDQYIANYLQSGQAKIIGIGREVVGRRKDGSTFPMDLAVSTFELDHKRYFTGIVRDITERKRAEEALKAADRHKNEFLATLAHELRNPLAPIGNSLRILRLAGQDPAAVGQALGTIERQMAQLVRLVDDLFDVARISRGKMELRKEHVDLAPLVRQAVEMCRPLAESQKQQLSVTAPAESIYLDADPVRIVQIVSNLLNNACKYTEAGGRIWLTVDREGSDLLVSVKDTGIGIPPQMLSRIFDMFSQVDQTLGQSREGLGIGLTLVKRLVEMHGGSVEARSDGPGLGSEFVVRLPLLVGESAVARAPATDDHTLAARRILVVDDNKDSAESLAMLLSIAGHQIRLAHDGEEALEAAKEFRPELVLLDIGLPRRNGFEVCRRIREQPWGQGMVLVALTGWGQDNDRRKSKDAGFDHHLVKPVDYDTLVNLLGELRPIPGCPRRPD